MAPGRGTTPKHLLHFFLSLFTIGLWLPVWILVRSSRSVVIVAPDVVVACEPNPPKSLLTLRVEACIFIVYTWAIMKTRVQKWGNSLALRIPKFFAVEAGLHANAAVELSLVEGTLVVQPITPQPLTLDQLLRGVTDENLPGEWDTGPAVGKEVW